LRQLRTLLLRIDRLRHRGFKPDRVTANIVIRCWLRCGAGLAGGEDDKFRIVRHKDGTVAFAWKKRSEAPFGTDDLRSMFKLVSDLMPVPSAPAGTSGAPKLPGPQKASISEVTSASVRELGSSPHVVDVDVDSDSAGDALLHYRQHIRPFARMMNRAFKRLGDHDGARMVLKWMSEQRKALGLGQREDFFRVGVEALMGVDRQWSGSRASGPSGASGASVAKDD
jgi:hypothetical protein